MKRACLIGVPCLGLYAWLLARPLMYLLMLRKLRRENPECFNGAAALAAVLEAIAQDGYV